MISSERAMTVGRWSFCLLRARRRRRGEEIITQPITFIYLTTIGKQQWFLAAPTMGFAAVRLCFAGCHIDVISLIFLFLPRYGRSRNPKTSVGYGATPKTGRRRCQRRTQWRRSATLCLMPGSADLQPSAAAYSVDQTKVELDELIKKAADSSC